ERRDHVASRAVTRTRAPDRVARNGTGGAAPTRLERPPDVRAQRSRDRRFLSHEPVVVGVVRPIHLSARFGSERGPHRPLEVAGGAESYRASDARVFTAQASTCAWATMKSPSFGSSRRNRPKRASERASSPSQLSRIASRYSARSFSESAARTRS